MKKTALFAFNGNLMCFAHAMLNVLDLHEKGYDAILIIEGAACSLLKELNEEQTPFHKAYRSIIDKKLLSCVCKACCAKLGTLEEAQKQELPLGADMSGHPSMEAYLQKGYEIITL
ncbi:DsrE family protein [Chitinivibrio alkaliphilus]|uniref:Cytoplasmic protein n=1 Tax=Chitinivibrio alkaliphilus ACht1 TaxID=1313304 RepID=U7DAH8_9BACT|nr:DsrE family protein [Chitinivibrio alkaliphilus]ERP32137.1 hypothetical protein CALK_0862 [Chitinivibrio alkaliphilus ACht1]